MIGYSEESVYVSHKIAYNVLYSLYMQALVYTCSCSPCTHTPVCTHTTCTPLIHSHSQEAEAIIDELKEQVDDALGAEEMVEKLTDQNLDLEEKIEQLNETVADLEALRDLSEEQEELRLEVEHDLREELDMSLNSVRQVRTLSLSLSPPLPLHIYVVIYFLPYFDSIGAVFFLI